MSCQEPGLPCPLWSPAALVLGLPARKGAPCPFPCLTPDPQLLLGAGLPGKRHQLDELNKLPWQHGEPWIVAFKSWCPNTEGWPGPGPNDPEEGGLCPTAQLSGVRCRPLDCGSLLAAGAGVSCWACLARPCWASLGLWG